ncbi:hypothetical protein HPB49_000429 [Dermacentor silvarum]|uniref:Uncharacterized protein n=1 Tax=Dermacentor silvarum TaxID=543639 RepID=A0ACB8CU99_DERSI|nr:hypothetical protein HPB49_000429 [Dermacentor silvarum]
MRGIYYAELHLGRGAASESEILSNFRRCQRVCNRVLSNTSLLGVVVGVGENLQNATATVGTGIRGGIQGVATGVRQGTAAVVENVRKNIQAVRNGIRPNRYPEDDYKENSPLPPEEQFYVVPAP